MPRSLVRTTHFRRPASRSQSSSAASGGKWSSWISTCAPAWRRAPATIFLPRERSTKRTSGSGGAFVELAPDRFFNIQPLATVVVGELVDGLARLVALGDDGSGNATADQDRPPEGDARIDDDNLRPVGRVLACEGVEPHDHSLRVPFDPAEIGLQDIPHRELARLRDVHEVTVEPDEKICFVGFKALLGERMPRAQALGEV